MNIDQQKIDNQLLKREVERLREKNDEFEQVIDKIEDDKERVEVENLYIGLTKIDPLPLNHPYDTGNELMFLEKRNNRMRDQVLEKYDEITQLKSTKHSLETRVRDLQNQIIQKESDFSTIISSKNALERKLLSEIDSLSVRVSRNKSKDDSYEIKEKIEQQISEKEDEIDNHLQKLLTLQEHLVKAKHQQSKTTTNFETNIKKERDIIFRIEEEQETINEYIRNIERDLGYSKDNNSSLEKEINDMKKRNEDLNKELQKLDSKNIKLEQFVKSLESRI